MDSKKRELVEQAKSIYLKYGIKSVTMDEMARQLGISKKTLYSFVNDKNELVELCVLAEHENEIEGIGKISEQHENAMDELLAIGKFVSSSLQKIHPSIFFDLAKYHPNVLKLMNEHKKEFVRGCVITNLEKGIKQGVYRSNLDAEIIATIYIATIDHIILGDIFQNADKSIDKIYKEFFRYHLKGIASPKGQDYLQELIKNDENF